MPTNPQPDTDTAGPGAPGTGKPEAPADAFARECRSGLTRAREALPAILAVQKPRTVDNTLVPYNKMLVDIERSSASAGLIHSVHPDKTVRDAAEACEQEAAAFVNELKLNRELFEAFNGLDTKGMDADTTRLVTRALRDFRRSGVDKDEATRKRVKEIDDELVVLGQHFSRNIVDDVRHIALTDAAGMKGLPKDYIDSHKPNAKGEILITTNYPDYIPFMTYAESSELRKELYVASRARGDKTNVDVLKKILTLRTEKVKLLGYASWADYATEDKMMKSGKNAASFIERVSRTAQKRARRDYAELLRYKKRHIDKNATRVDDHEKSYIENKVKAQSYSYDAQEVRPYFPYRQVEQGLLDITAEMYGVQYRPAADAETWHQDVRAFDVMRGGEKMGRIFLDMHPREGKYQHAAQFTLRSGVVDQQLPEGVLVCNFPNPRTEPPALMEHDDVVTMFHEFGHLMHHVLGGQQRWIEQSGVATEWDFVEAPSQMFEEWAWSHDTIKRFARHHETGAVIPEEMVLRMRKADKFGIGLQTVQQMFYASVSLRFHTLDPNGLDMPVEVRRLQEKYTPFKFVAGTSFHTNFGHLNGYSALYYTYMWSLVIAKDLLTPFHRHGLMNPEWTFKYRDLILARGGTKDAADLVKEFLGRDFNFKAFEDYLTKDAL
ncbi:MAG TPA: M3 family metallopeptidase [Kofleriaceae bacterium]|nr:M3 family metallopeptidase [Kofleriaceae bacterium]